MRVLIQSIPGALFRTWQIVTALCGFTAIVTVIQILLLLFIASMGFTPKLPEQREEMAKLLPEKERTLSRSDLFFRSAACFDTQGNVSVVYRHRDNVGAVVMDDPTPGHRETYDMPPPIPLPLLNFPHCQLDWSNEEVEFMLRFLRWPTPVLGTDLVGRLPQGNDPSATWFRWDICRQVWSLTHPHRRPFGYLGRNGLTHTPTRSDRLGRPQWVELMRPVDDKSERRISMVTRHAVFDLNLADMTTTTLFEDRGNSIVRVRSSGWTGSAMFTGTGAYSATTSTAYRPLLTLYMEEGPDRLFLRSPDEQIALEPRDANGQRLHGVYAATRGGLYFLHRHADVIPPRNIGFLQFGGWYLRTRESLCPMVENLYGVAPDGSLSPIGSFRWRHAPATPLLEVAGFGSAPFVPVITAVSPLVWGPAMRVLLSGELRQHFDETMRGNPRRASTFLCTVVPFFERELRPRNLRLAGLIAAAACVCVLVLSRCRMGWTRTLFWLALVAAFNVSGLLTYLCLAHRSPFSSPSSSTDIAGERG